MKSLKKVSGLFFLGAVALSFTFASCHKSDDDKKDRLKLEPNKVEVAVGETVSVAVSGGTEPYEAVVKDEKIATTQVDNKTITIAGVSEGATTVTVTDKKELNGTILVKVKKSAELKFDKENVDIEVDKEDVVTIEGGVAPYAAKVEDASIASASVDGDEVTVKGIKAGTTTITVTDKDEVNSGTISVTVK